MAKIVSEIQTLASKRNMQQRRISYTFNNLYEMMEKEEAGGKLLRAAEELESNMRKIVDENWTRRTTMEELIPCQST